VATAWPECPALRAQPASAGLAGWRRSATGRFCASTAGRGGAARRPAGVRIQQDDARTNAYVYQRAEVARPLFLRGGCPGVQRGCRRRSHAPGGRGTVRAVQELPPHGAAPAGPRARAQAPSTLYTLRLTAAVSAGAATAGVAFFGADGAVITAAAADTTGSTALRMASPQGAMAASVFVGKFDGEGGCVEARAPASARAAVCTAPVPWRCLPQWRTAAASPADALPASARNEPRRARAQVDSASFGADAASVLGVDVSALVRRLAPTGGPGICVNYYTDGPSEHNNGGRGYLEALQQLRPGTLRYPGGEKSDSCACPRARAAAGAAWLCRASLCMRNLVGLCMRRAAPSMWRRAGARGAGTPGRRRRGQKKPSRARR
jgi:hypothetical protein